jgi:transposase
MFIYEETHKTNQTFDRNVSKVFIFPPNICQIGRNMREHTVFIKCNSESSTVNVKLIEIMKIAWFSPMSP